jgi:hypothetical protein
MPVDRRQLEGEFLEKRQVRRETNDESQTFGADEMSKGHRRRKKRRRKKKKRTSGVKAVVANMDSPNILP